MMHGQKNIKLLFYLLRYNEKTGFIFNVYITQMK